MKWSFNDSSTNDNTYQVYFATQLGLLQSIPQLRLTPISHRYSEWLAYVVFSKSRETNGDVVPAESRLSISKSS